MVPHLRTISCRIPQSVREPAYSSWRRPLRRPSLWRIIRLGTWGAGPCRRGDSTSRPCSRGPLACRVAAPSRRRQFPSLAAVRRNDCPVSKPESPAGDSRHLPSLAERIHGTSVRLRGHRKLLLWCLAGASSNFLDIAPHHHQIVSINGVPYFYRDCVMSVSGLPRELQFAGYGTRLAGHREE